MPDVATSIFHGEWTLTVVLGVAMWCIALALQLRPPTAPKLARCVSALLLVAGAEMLAGLAIGERWWLRVAVPVGAVALIASVWLALRSDRHKLEAGTASPSPAATSRIGIDADESSVIRTTRTTIRGQDTSVRLRGASSHIDEDSTIE